MTDSVNTEPPRYYSSLKNEHKVAAGLLSVGTFLEYFDLMLFMHLAVLLNEMFFPKQMPTLSSYLRHSHFVPPISCDHSALFFWMAW